jgi:hypothetical protein
VTGSRIQYQSSLRAARPILVLCAIAVALLAFSAPALAWDGWKHSSAQDEGACDGSGCHVESTSSNTSCIGCHTSFTTSGGQKCWQCHRPGQSMTTLQTAAGCSSSCHLEAGDRNSYATAFTHGTAPHVGASSAPCTTCHGVSGGAKAPGTSPHHDAVDSAAPTCAKCHDGTMASAKQGHAGYACEICHAGMTRPSVPAVCNGCHAAQRFGAVTCTACHSATGMTGKETIHTTDPAATVSCTTCHQKHFEDLGACDTCHGSHAETHHGTATLSGTRLTIAAKPAKIRARAKAMLKGKLLAGATPLASQSVLIERRLKDGSFKKVAVVTTRADGRFSRVVGPRVSTTYRVVWRPAGALMLQQRPAIVTVKLRVRK